jgi:hypothetical protein
VKDELGISLDKADDSILGLAAKVGRAPWLSSISELACAAAARSGSHPLITCSACLASLDDQPAVDPPCQLAAAELLVPLAAVAQRKVVQRSARLPRLLAAARRPPAGVCEQGAHHDCGRRQHPGRRGGPREADQEPGRRCEPCRCVCMYACARPCQPGPAAARPGARFSAAFRAALRLHSSCADLALARHAAMLPLVPLPVSCTSPPPALHTDASRPRPSMRRRS